MQIAQRILIIDDESEKLRPLQRLLEAYGRAVTLVNSIDSALKVLETDQPEIVLIDYQMADISGVEFVERVRPAFPACKFIMMSGAPDEVLQDFCERCDIPLLLKPFKTAYLLKLLM